MFTFAIFIVGLTVTVTKNGEPVHVTPAFVYVGVTVYTTTTGKEVALDKVCEIFACAVVWLVAPTMFD